MKGKKEGERKGERRGEKKERKKRKGEREKKKQSSTAGLELVTFHSTANATAYGLALPPGGRIAYTCMYVIYMYISQI